LPKHKLTKTQVNKELKRRDKEKKAALFKGFSVEALAAGHKKQLAFILDDSKHQILVCSRRAGKTWGDCGKLAWTAISKPKTNSLYIVLTHGQAKESVWEGIWLKLCDQWGFPCRHNKSQMLTTFENGSTVRFRGTDDIKTIKTFLGNKYALVIIDEGQDQGDTLLEPLLLDILPHALADENGSLVLTGTIPEVAYGMFYDLFTQENSWSKHNWGRLDNPHVENQLEALEEYLKAYPWKTHDSPDIQRNFYGKFAYDPLALVFQYLPSLAVPAAPTGDPWVTQLASAHSLGLKYFSVGIDPGTRDRCAITVLGWSDDVVYQVYEWVTPKDNKSQLSDIKTQLDKIDKLYPVSWRYMDQGGSQLAIDTFANDTGKYVVHAAKKVDMVGQIDRMNNLLQQNRLRIIVGSELESDLMTTRWDIKAKAKGQNRYSSHNHPDVADSCRYALQGFFETFKPEPQKKLTHQEADFLHMQTMAKAALEPPQSYGTVNPDAYSSNQSDYDSFEPYGASWDIP